MHAVVDPQFAEFIVTFAIRIIDQKFYCGLLVASHTLMQVLLW